MENPKRILIIEARYYEDIANSMADGAIKAISDEGGLLFERMSVPGVFEIPAAVNFVNLSCPSISKNHKYAGIVALGCVIRGETDHYEHVCREASRALMDLSINSNIALGFGILTCDTKQQAKERSAVDGRNKGSEAAKACLRMIEFKNFLKIN